MTTATVEMSVQDMTDARGFLLREWERARMAHEQGMRRGPFPLRLPEFGDRSTWEAVMLNIIQRGEWPKGGRVSFRETPVGEVTAGKPYRVPARRLSPFDAAARFASKETARKNLRGVYSDPEGDFRVATDGRMMIVCHDPDIPEDHYQTTRTPKGAHVIADASFPNWRMAMEKRDKWMERPLSAVIRPESPVMGRLETAYQIGRLFPRSGANCCHVCPAVLWAGEGWVCLNPEYVLTALKTCFELGAGSVQLRVNSDALVGPVFFGCSKAVGVIMPIRLKNDGALPYECCVRLNDGPSVN